MAIFTPGALIANVSGNLAGINFARGPSGPYIRKRLTRTDSSTTPQLAHRATLQRIHSQWLDLSNLQRKSWSSAAAQFPAPNRLAIPLALSGWQLFLKICATAGHEFLEPIVTPPRMVISPQPYNLALSIALPATYSLTWDPITAPVDYSAVLFGARPVSSNPRTHFTSWRFLGAIDPAIDPWNFQSIWVAALGPPIAGELVAVKLRIWRLNRLPSPFSQATATVS